MDEMSLCVSEYIVNLTNPYWAVRWMYSDTDKLIESVIIPCFSIFGFIGNLAFLWTVYRVRELSTTLNGYLANLAICDILFLAFFIGWPAANLSSDPDPVNRAYPVNSAFGCVFYVITTRLWYFASVQLTTLISIERYLAICHQVKHRMITGRKYNIILLCIVWITSLVITLTIIPRFVVFRHYCLVWPNSPEFAHTPSSFNTCLSVPGFKSKSGAFEGLLYIIFFILAMTLNTFLYAKIIIALSRRRMSNEANTVRNQVARTLVATGIAFFICQFPYRLYSLDDVIDDMLDVDIFDTQPKVTILITGRLFLTLNSIINPYIYVFSCRQYRQAMKQAFGMKSSQVTPEQSVNSMNNQ